MAWTGWAEIALILVIVGVSSPLLAASMARVFAGERTLLSPVIAPLERGFYAAAGVDPAKGQDWRRYLLAMLVFNAAA
jgi:potassium-transporting ATPase potassium-binding subunit